MIEMMKVITYAKPVRLQRWESNMSEASVDVVVEVHETDGDYYNWYLRVEWYGEETFWTGFATAGDAVNKAIRTYPGMTIRAEIIPYVEEPANVAAN
jgi:hypothetical protein